MAKISCCLVCGNCLNGAHGNRKFCSSDCNRAFRAEVEKSAPVREKRHTYAKNNRQKEYLRRKKWRENNPDKELAQRLRHEAKPEYRERKLRLYRKQSAALRALQELGIEI